jgi:hypothetical protein
MIHLIKAIENALQERNYYAALATSLALPDICGWIEDPSIGSKARCIAWFDRFMQRNYTRAATHFRPEHVFLTGSDFYALRCSYLHEGRDDITDQRAKQILDSFQFVVPPIGWTVHMNQSGTMLQLQVDIFCREILQGTNQFLSEIADNSAATQRLSSLLLIRDIQGQPIQ